jgi:hypothetical protein
MISEHCVAVDPRKVAAVAEWALPTSCTIVSSFGPMTNFFPFSDFFFFRLFENP